MIRPTAAIVSLDRILNSIDSLPWNYALYLAGVAPWNAATLGAALDPNDVDEDTDEPEFATSNGLRYVLTIATVQDIVLNVRQQRVSASTEEWIAALNYYYANDAYLTL